VKLTYIQRIQTFIYLHIGNQNQTLYSFSSFFSPLSHFMLNEGKGDKFGDTVQ